MRLIDADALKVDYIVPSTTTGTTSYEYVSLFQILNAPTIEERKTGKWVFKHNSSDIWCSECDENYEKCPGEFNYCPNCGADMKGDANE